MLEAPRVVSSPARMTAVVHLTVPRAEIQQVMGPALQEVRDVLAAQGIAPDGPWFTHHLRMAPDTFDFEVGIPVATPVTASGRVRPGELREATVVRAVHRGGYEGLPASWGQLQAWIQERGHASAADLWEVYMVGPESSPDPDDWRTELNRPLEGGGSERGSVAGELP